MVKLYTAVYITLVATVVSAQQITPIEAYSMAMEHYSLPQTPKSMRYIWCPKGTPEENAAVAFVTNTVLSHSTVDVTPIILNDGAIVGIDLAMCAPDEKDLARLLTVWDKLVINEPYFHVRVRRDVKEYKALDGKSYSFRYVDIPAPYLQGQSATGLVFRVDHFISRLLDTADNGLYYDFRGIKGLKLDAYLQSRGAERGAIKKLRTDERAAMISDVTNKARGINILPSQGVRLSTGPALIAVTDDPFDDTVDADFDPFRTLLESKTNGHEVIATLPNGWLEYTIWDAEGNLVDEAPPNLVADHEIPRPNTRRLQGAISCIRCHGKQDLWQPFNNEVKIAAQNVLNPLGIATANKDQRATLQRLAGLYMGELDQVILAAQNSVARRVFATCRMTTPQVTDAITALYNARAYTRVDARVACEELGEQLLEGDTTGVQTFKRVVPPLDPSGLSLDDPIIGRLHVEYLDFKTKTKRGLELTRKQWDQVYVDAMLRKIKGAANDN